MFRDPVCLAEVDELRATQSGLTTDSNSRIYYFCSEECKLRFDKDPGAFIANLEAWDAMEMTRSWPVE